MKVRVKVKIKLRVVGQRDKGHVVCCDTTSSSSSVYCKYVSWVSIIRNTACQGYCVRRGGKTIHIGELCPDYSSNDSVVVLISYDLI